MSGIYNISSSLGIEFKKNVFVDNQPAICMILNVTAARRHRHSESSFQFTVQKREAMKASFIYVNTEHAFMML
eukprot:snap_masked-scaffold_4-processed-gene-8.26-mRNA-1 protein AED:1.00 eAED:1.00 QI:0/-1/0/0/-1/1/1/0/72